MDFGAVLPSFFGSLGRMLIWVGRDESGVFAFQYQPRLAELKSERSGDGAPLASVWVDNTAEFISLMDGYNISDS
jgi:hypothetical protein